LLIRYIAGEKEVGIAAMPDNAVSYSPDAD
jgi:hypothetical protein